MAQMKRAVTWDGRFINNFSQKKEISYKKKYPKKQQNRKFA